MASMNCNRAAWLISEELDGRLDEAQAARLRSHLESCPDCGKLAAALASTSDLVTRLDKRGPSESFDEVLRHKLSIARALEIDRPLGRNLFREALANWVLKPAALAAVIVLAAFGLAKMAPVAEPPMFAEASALVEAIDNEFEQHNAMESMMDDAAFTLYELTTEEEREIRP